MRLAIISDVHGNLEALRCVTTHLARQGADVVVNLGDCVSAPLWPRETWEELGLLGAVTVRGNHDRWLGDADRIAGSATVAFTAAALGPAAVEVLTALPASVALSDEVFACHGTPESDTEYLLEESVGGRLCTVTTGTLGDRLGTVTQGLVLCGHSHQQQSAWATGGRLVVNPGSVGCPRYAGNVDVRANEAGAPHARYAIATGRDGQWSVETFALAYDWWKVAARARSLGRDDWAHAFLKGAT